MNASFSVVGESANPATGRQMPRSASVPAAVPPAPLWRLPTVLSLVPHPKRTLYRLIGEGKFPAPIKIGLRAVAWRREDVLSYLDDLTAVAE